MFYLFHGDDEFSRSKMLAELKRKMGDPAMAELNTSVFDGRKATLGEIKHACDAAPFFAERRLVIVEGLLARLEGEELEGLLSYLRQLPETTRLVFVEEKLIPKDNPVRRLAEEQGVVKEFKRPRRDELSHWIEGQVREKGGKIERAAVEALAAFVGDDLRLLDHEIDKLLAYVNWSRPINVDDVHLLVSYVRAASVFKMVDALGQRDRRRATKLLHRLLDEGEHPLALLGMIVRQFRIILQVKELNERGLSTGEISAKLRLPSFIVEKGLRQARNFSMGQLEAIYGKLLEADVAIKTGQMDAALALDMLVMGGI